MSDRDILKRKYEVVPEIIVIDPQAFKRLHKDIEEMNKNPTITYGELVVIGYNGCLPGGNKGRRRNLFSLKQKAIASGVKPAAQKVFNSAQAAAAHAVTSSAHHSVSYTLSKSQTVVVEYQPDPTTDMFQVGRSTEPVIDYVVIDTVPGAQSPEQCHVTESTISRYACRIVVERQPPHRAHIYAAGFDSQRNIFLGEKACKWTGSDSAMDGLTTNGILVMRPRDGFSGSGNPGSGVWREVSVGGRVYSLRQVRSSPTRGQLIPDEDNLLEDGTLIDLCGATLLWRSASGLISAPSQTHIERLREDINKSRPQCPVGMMTLVLPSRAKRQESEEKPTYVCEEKQTYVYINCGHVHGYHVWGQSAGVQGDGERVCPMCREVGPYVPMFMGNESAFYVDGGAPTHAFNPCGHVCSEQTARYWSLIRLPQGTSGFQATCPFCACALNEDKPYVKLIFQDPLD